MTDEGETVCCYADRKSPGFKIRQASHGRLIGLWKMFNSSLDETAPMKALVAPQTRWERLIVVNHLKKQQGVATNGGRGH